MSKMGHGAGLELLKYENQWEVDVFSIVYQTHSGKKLGSKRINDLRRVKIHFKSYDVNSRVVSVPYSDHGHSYNGTSKHYFVKETVFAKEFEFDLGTLMSNGVVVFAEDWSEA
jgi:hypothetical protein